MARALPLAFLGPSLASVLALGACSSSGSHGAADAAANGGRGAASNEGGPDATSGTGATLGDSAAAGGSASTSHDAGLCNDNRPSGLAVNSGTSSFELDGKSESGDAQILWDGQLNHVTQMLPNGSSLEFVFPGCTANMYALPPVGTKISITYTDDAAGSTFTCSYLDPSLSDATCAIDVARYGVMTGDSVSGTFSGTLERSKGDAPVGTHVVSSGMFFMQRP